MPTNSEITIRGGYNPFTLKRDHHLDIFANAVEKITQQHEKALEQQAAIKTALANVKLNEAEDKWKQDYIEDISKQIDNASRFGNYSTALSTATKLAGDAVSNPALLGRVRANEQFEKERTIQEQRRERGDISQSTFDWWMANNPYNYEDITDENGKIIGGSTYKPAFRPVNDINWASAAMAAFKMITPYKSSTSTDGGTSVTNNTGADITRGGKTYKSGESISSSGHSSQSQEKVTKEQIVARMEELLKSTGDGYRQAEQAYDVANYEFENMIKQYNNLIEENPDSTEAKDLGQKIEARKQLMYKNGSKIDYKEYYARMITDSLFAEGLAYDWRTSSSGGTSSYSISDLSGGSRGGGNRTLVQSSTPFKGAKFNYDTGLWEGTLVRQDVDTQSAQNSVSNSSKNISNRFN